MLCTTLDDVCLRFGFQFQHDTRVSHRESGKVEEKCTIDNIVAGFVVVATFSFLFVLCVCV